jgi:pimeloyl-ACP methyl ester carboxylesterase
MTAPQLHFVACLDTPFGAAVDAAPSTHNVAYWQWGNPQASHVVVCAHGLSRQGRDFDMLAQSLCARAQGEIRVICPDVAGRGQSDWLKDPSAYQVPIYAMDMLALLAQVHRAAPIAQLDWVGTSMGGLIGMVVAGQPGLPLPCPVRRMVLNDVGPVLQWEALQRIGSYVGNTGRFATVQEAADALWALSTGFGPHTPAQWLALSTPMTRPIEGDAEGAVTLHYDPAIGAAFRTMTPESAVTGEAALWQLYDGITAQVLVTRGAESDLLSPATAAAMGQRGPRAQLREFAGVGHAPMFIAQDQIDTVMNWLLSDVLSDGPPVTSTLSA